MVIAHRGIAQLVEYWSPKPWVVGSSPSAPAKKSASFGLPIFLSKPQDWHIIAARSAVYIIKGAKNALVSHHAPVCIFLRLDDIQSVPLW